MLIINSSYESSSTILIPAEGCTRANNNNKFRHRHTSYPTTGYSKQQLFILFTFRNINKHVDIHASTNMLIFSAAFVSLLQSQSIAFAVQCRSFTPSLWAERSLNKSQNRQFAIITMYQVTFNPNSSRRTSLHWGRWLPGINTLQYFVRVPGVDVDRYGSLRGRRPRRLSVPLVGLVKQPFR